MEVLSLTSIQLVFYACRTNGVPITYDFTDPLNAIRSGCNIMVECGSTMNEAIQILLGVKEKLLTHDVEIEHFNFQFRIDIGALQNLKKPMNQTKLNIPQGKHAISIFLPDDTTCFNLYSFFDHWEYLKNPTNWVFPDSVPNVRNIGFGYNEGLIGCSRTIPPYFTTKTYLLTTISLGKSSCVVESFGLFKKRMDDIHTKNLEFIKQIEGSQLQFIDYSLTSHCIGLDYYNHLLEKYWERYTNNKIRATIPMPIGRFKIPSSSANKIIPYIDSKNCRGRESYRWYAPAALEALSRYFGAVVLTPVQWKELQSNAAKIANTGNPDLRLDLFIDYTDWLQYNFRGRDDVRSVEIEDEDWSVESELNELDDTILHPLEPLTPNLENIKVTALIFSIKTSPPAENFMVNFNSGLVQRISSQLKIGCAFGPNSFGTLLNSTSSAVVAACKQVNGSLYILQFEFKLKSITEVNKENSHHFENVVRPKLEERKKFKEEILVLHPQTTVYFQLSIELQMDDNQETVFCNSEAFSLNEYIEAIANWAALNGIQLIMGRAFDDHCQSKYQTWFSVLRPTNPENFINLLFILPNSPKILADVEVESCLDWTVKKPVVTESYFHNNYVGSLFLTVGMREERPITLEEYEILLQLIFHRFELVMVLVTSDTYKDFIIAINTLASEGLIDPTKKLFILYADPREEVEGEEKLREFYGFLNFTRVTLGSHMSLLKGITFPKAAFESNTENQNLTFRTLAVDRVRSSSLDMGFLLDIDKCRYIVMNTVSRKNISKESDDLLQSAKYLCCWDYVRLKYSPEHLGMIFDTHLYIKKVYQLLYPHLDVYFKIFVFTYLTETTITDYLILLSHFRKFASAYNLSYLIVDAFDESLDKPNGWWKISNYSNLSLTSIYEEKYAASVGFPTWVPSLHLKQNQITNTVDDNKQNQTNTADDNKKNQTTNTAGDNKQNQTTSTADDNTLYIILGALTFGLVITIVVSGLLLRYYKNKVSQYLSNEEEKEFYNGKEGTSEEQTAGYSEYCKFDKKFELAFADIVIDPKDLLGRGNFGTVYKGLVKEDPVAIKRPNDNCPATSFKSVLSEAKLLCYIGTHPNLIQFVGAYTKEIRKGILYIVTELCSNGSLDGLLRAKKRVVSNMGEDNNQTIGTEEKDSVYSHELHRFSMEIASGMDYIAGKNVIHGDLAARNVLLDENFTCKIGDFGLSRKLYEYQQYVKQSQEPLPWKWMAYESLKNMQFTTKSDVWSYGVTLWEIYSLGSVPYGGLSWTTGFADDLKNGLRLQMPEYATEEIYKVMLCCWQLEADERPTFTGMVDFFKNLTSSQ